MADKDAKPEPRSLEGWELEELRVLARQSLDARLIEQRREEFTRLYPDWLKYQGEMARQADLLNIGPEVDGLEFLTILYVRAKMESESASPWPN